MPSFRNSSNIASYLNKDSFRRKQKKKSLNLYRVLHDINVSIISSDAVGFCTCHSSPARTEAGTCSWICSKEWGEWDRACCSEWILQCSAVVT